MFTLRTLREGRWPLALTGVWLLATVGWCPVASAALLPLLCFGFVLAFFRDPEVRVPADERSVVAPASGKIVEVRPVEGGTMVAIFLSVFDVHVQRAPIAGTITRVAYQPGRFLDARRPEAAAQNECRRLEITAADGYRVTVRQIAGLIARRIVGWVGEGAVVARGERLGMIKFGSRVELVLPGGTEITARAGQVAVGGETILGRRP
jgi:phosphatidylserine decarboxylase